MKIKERIYEECPSCGHRTGMKQEEEYGCDECKKPINRGLHGKHHAYLDVAVFRNSGSGDSEHREYCSWKCCLAGVKKIRTDYFVALPFLTYDSTQKGIRARDFFDAIRGKRK